MDLAGFNPFDEAVLADPAPWYACMRKSQPVFEVPGRGFWLVTRHEDVMAAVRDTEVFSNKFKSPGSALGRGSPEVQAQLDAILAEGYPQTPTMLTNDPPAHTRFRRLVARAFTPKRVASWQPSIERTTDELIDRFAPGRVEVVEELAVPLPIGVIADALGVPRDMQPTFRRWTDDSTDLIGANVTDERRLAAARGLVEFQQYFAAELEERRGRPRDDFLTDLVHATVGDDTEGLVDTRPLDTAEMLSILHQLLVAGNETTTSLLAEATRMLVNQPDEWRRLAAEPAYAPLVVEEALRLASPAQGMFRVVTRDTVLGGVEIPTGATVILMYASANRDETAWPAGDEFCPEREGVRSHLAFGYGTHFCIGAALSRAEAQTALPRLCARVRNPRFATGEPFRYKPSFVLRGLRALSLEFDPQ